ncbi:rRNA maturation RNase YbeY [Methylacidiphilum caldifontis]|uniref:rRNA maturation RNase YbeY n=1 Tax=Methylacidiphilum caldifontis TaxID=2795386 RepID=A0A4Y8PH23_9BACT|nr:rRNA maturation RNase YbeY [Methylacidiphilum caldifontis]
MPNQLHLPQKIYLVLLSSKTMGEIHGLFFNDPSPTDVISFDYGEILICPLVAEREAHSRSIPVLKEVLLYGIHGMLHLCGMDDRREEERKQMEVQQEFILKSIWEKLGFA